VSRKVQGSIVILLAVAGVLSVGEGSRIYLKAILAQILLQNAWSQTQNGQSQVKPWPWADMYPVAQLEVAALDADMIVLAGSTGATLAFGPGYMLSSARPGEDDNTVLVAHRDTHFNFLKDIAIGETILLKTPDGKIHRYSVSEAEILHQSATHVLEREGIKALTLITCWPFDAIVPGGPLRYVVRALGEAPTLASTN
jgi:sortase A